MPGLAAGYSKDRLGDRVVALEAAVRLLQTARRLEMSNIAADGITVRGGSIDIEDDGDVNIHDGGSLRAYYASGNLGMLFGPQRFVGAEDTVGHGLLIQRDADDPADRSDIFRARLDHDGISRVIVGQTDVAVDQTWINAVSLTLLGDEIIFIPQESTTLAANLRIDIVTGHAQIVTSAAGGKLDVRDLTIDADEVLKLRPRIWRDKNAADRGTDVEVIGFVADEVAQVPALEPLVDRGADGAPAGIQYERVSAVHHDILREHHIRLAEAEAELAEQKTINAALLARLERLERLNGIEPEPAADHGGQLVADGGTPQAPARKP